MFSLQHIENLDRKNFAIIRASVIFCNRQRREDPDTYVEFKAMEVDYEKKRAEKLRKFGELSIQTSGLTLCCRKGWAVFSLVRERFKSQARSRSKILLRHILLRHSQSACIREIYLEH